ncbi:MAG: arginine--tRNA ligase [Verrucomicrobia bacterium Tous-C9LFEB]|nr:MAG: arginine--tRNA ligase [Verrucomicrobia bacterium Tous-C9LFEB]
MKTPRQEVEAIVAATAQTLYGADVSAGPYVRPCPDTRHGDFQTNLAMVQAKKAGKNPRELAQQIVDALAEHSVFEKPEIAGPGFVNFRLKAGYCAAQTHARSQDVRLGVEPAVQPLKVVIDYSGPNIAKELHVGHLRSTILGDSLARLFRFLGHNVISDNHLGDWGTQFGIVILGYKRDTNKERFEQDPIGYLEEVYVRTQNASKTDDTIREAARAELVKLQAGDPENVALWKSFIDHSLQSLDRTYSRLDVKFDYTLGESFYNDRLPGVVKALLDAGIARETEGAIAVFSDGTLPQKDDPFIVTEKGGAFRDNPFLIRKSDGGFNYATTDLATLQYRKEHFHADKVIYVTDSRQQMHFAQLFATEKRWNLGLNLQHVWFGAILGADKKPLKTRDGGTVKLRALLDEAQERAEKIITEKRPDLEADKRNDLAQVVGIGALKYADLAQNRNLDYVFNWDKLLAFDGNTAPYLINAYVRIRAIFRKLGSEAPQVERLVLAEEAEIALAKKLLDFGDSLTLAADEYRPHYLCVYLFELAGLFHKFYEHCPVLISEGETKTSRLVLCALTAQTLKTGLALLGIKTVEQM